MPEDTYGFKAYQLNLGRIYIKNGQCLFLFAYKEPQTSSDMNQKIHLTSVEVHALELAYGPQFVENKCSAHTFLKRHTHRAYALYFHQLKNVINFFSKYLFNILYFSLGIYPESLSCVLTEQSERLITNIFHRINCGQRTQQNMTDALKVQFCFLYRQG